MTKRAMSDEEGEMPSLLSLALFAAVFFPAIVLAEFGADLVGPVQVFLTELPESLKAASLGAFILGTMAIARIMALLTGHGSEK